MVWDTDSKVWFRCSSIGMSFVSTKPYDTYIGVWSWGQSPFPLFFLWIFTFQFFSTDDFHTIRVCIVRALVNISIFQHICIDWFTIKAFCLIYHLHQRATFHRCLYPSVKTNDITIMITGIKRQTEPHQHNSVHMHVMSIDFIRHSRHHHCRHRLLGPKRQHASTQPRNPWPRRHRPRPSVPRRGGSRCRRGARTRGLGGVLCSTRGTENLWGTWNLQTSI